MNKRRRKQKLVILFCGNVSSKINDSLNFKCNNGNLILFVVILVMLLPICNLLDYF